MGTIKPRLTILFRVLAASLLGATVAVAQTRTGTITVGPQPCAAVAQLNEAPGAAYTPGIDARGNAVAPADLPGSGNPELAKALAQRPVKITSALLGKYGIPANARPFGGRAELGYVTVQDGKAYLDGQELSPPEAALLSDACRQAR